MTGDPFSKCHPAVNLIFFVCVIGFGVTVQHPAYLVVSAIFGGLYYFLLLGKKGCRLILGLLPLFFLIAVLNPLINSGGSRVLFFVFGRRYTLEALCYGAAIGAIFVVTMVWFGCASRVLTSDKFTALFGNLIPAISLLLVMVLRMIPGFRRKAAQIIEARSAIGKGADSGASWKSRAADGAGVLSSLTDWALEGSIVTSDSMAARGYATGRRTTFYLHMFTRRDGILLGMIAVLSLCTIAAGNMEASYTPQMDISLLNWGLAMYSLLLLLPSLMQIREVLLWNSFISKI